MAQLQLQFNSIATSNRHNHTETIKADLLSI